MDMDLSFESKKKLPQTRDLEKSEIRRRILKMANIKKKTKELSILCDTPVFLIAHYSDGKTETLPEDESELMELITKYKSTKRNKKFQFVKRPNVTNRNDDTTRAERFTKLTSFNNRDIVMRVIRERIGSLKRRRSEIQKIGKPGNRAEIEIVTPVNLGEIDIGIQKKTGTPVDYCQINTEIIMESDSDEDEEEEEPDQFTKSPPRSDQSPPRFDQSPPRPDQFDEQETVQLTKSPPPADQFSLNYIPIQGTLYVPRNFKIGDNLSEEHCKKFPPIFMPQHQQEQLGSSLERDFIAGFDAATFSTKKLG